MQLSAHNDVLSTRIPVRPSMLILLVAALGALVCAARLAPLVRITDEGLRIQDFAYHYLLAGIAESTAEGGPYSSEARRSHIEALCIDELNRPCRLSRETQPVGLSPIGFVGLLGLSKVCGGDSRGALLGYALLAGATCFASLLLAWRLFRLLKQNLLFGVPLFAMLALSITVPFEEALVHGQPSFLVAAVVAFVMLNERNTNPVLLGSVLTLAAIKPHYFASAFVLFAAAREWRAILFGVVGLLVLAALACAIYGSSMLAEYPAVLRQYAAGMTFQWFENPFNLGRYLPLRPYIVKAAGAIIAELISVVSVWQGSARIASCLPLAYVFFSPYVPRYELAVLIIPAVGLLRERMSLTFSVTQKPKKAGPAFPERG